MELIPFTKMSAAGNDFIIIDNRAPLNDPQRGQELARSICRRNADLYVNFGAVPSATTYQCRPYLNGNNETCTVTSPSAGTFYVGVRPYSEYSDVTLTTTYTAQQ